MVQLHKKIQQLRNSIGTAPMLFANRYSQQQAPAAIRKAKSSVDEERVIKQYHCLWGIPDDYGTMPIKGCFSKSISERGPNSDSAYKIIALYNHRLSDSVGIPYVLEEDEVGLYSETAILKGVQVAEETLIRHRAKVLNNGSYGFNYVWDKMEYDEKNDVVVMKECELFEVSFVPIGSQMETYGVRSADGILTDNTLPEETEELIKSLPRKHQIAVRSLIGRHISLAKQKPLEQRQQALGNRKPKKSSVNYNFLISNLKLNEKDIL